MYVNVNVNVVGHWSLVNAMQWVWVENEIIICVRMRSGCDITAPLSRRSHGGSAEL